MLKGESMLTPRRIEIFKAIVDEYIRTAEPVGSKTLQQKYKLPYSSATIRNDMQILEEMGYLEKTHTSSGRIPSTLGYKFYCENLLSNSALTFPATGIGAYMIDSPSLRSARCCHNSSVMNGINGWSIRRSLSK